MGAVAAAMAARRVGVGPAEPKTRCAQPAARLSHAARGDWPAPSPSPRHTQLGPAENLGDGVRDNAV